jgi:preprotein translocase subunit SecB
MEERYAEVINDIDILEICLNDLKFKKQHFPDPEKYPDVKATFTAKKSNYKQENSHFEVFQDIEFLLEEFTEDRKKSRKIFELKAGFYLVYSLQIEIDEELFGIFKKRNLPVNLHPYARELIQSSLARVGLPAFTLPVLKVKR